MPSRNDYPPRREILALLRDGPRNHMDIVKAVNANVATAKLILLELEGEGHTTRTVRYEDGRFVGARYALTASGHALARPHLEAK